MGVTGLGLLSTALHSFIYHLLVNWGLDCEVVEFDEACPRVVHRDCWV